MENVNISVIVPVYNGEKYLNLLMDSLIAQRDVHLEFIIVDNGSSDSSLEILQSYIKRDARIKLITLENNQGVYGARNLALKAAKGEYIAFSDCDDYVCPGAYSALYNAAKKYDSDVVIGDFKHVYDSGEMISFFPQHTPDMFEPLMCGGAIWNKLFRRKLIMDNNIEFPPRNHMEDNVFLGRVYRCRPSIIIEHRDVYHYMQRMKNIDTRLTGSNYTSVVQSFESVQELYLQDLPCDESEVFRCFWGALHYLKDLWFNMDSADQQKETYEMLRKTIFTLPWSGREDLFYWCFKIQYADFLTMRYEDFISAALRAELNEVLKLNKEKEIQPLDALLMQFKEGKIGLRSVFQLVQAWISFKVEHMKNLCKNKFLNMKSRIKSISFIRAIVIFREYTYRGFKLYKQFCAKYGANTHFLLIPYEGTGDSYIVGGILKQYLKENGIKKYIILQPLSRGAKVLKIFDIDHVQTLSISERNWLSQFQIFCGNSLPNLHIMHFHPCHHVPISGRVQGINGISFRQMYELSGFSFECFTPPSKLSDKDVIKAEFKEKGLIFGKTVILAPYAETIPGAPKEFWVYVSGELKKRGYIVCTNSSGEKEPLIPGTIGVFYSYSQMIPLLEVAGSFIGVRSGLCDVISSANCTKIILYPRGFEWGKGLVSNYFSLNKMKLCNNAKELEFDAAAWTETANTIIEKVGGAS